MILHVSLGVGAGLVSAFLFAAIGARTVPAVLLMYLAPLPMLIVALGWHHLLGLLALSVGGIAVSLMLRPSAGIAFALGPALSAWFLAYLALLARPAVAANDDGPRWYPVGYLLLWLSIAGALIGLSSLVAATGGDFERYRATLEETASSLVRGEAGTGRNAPLPQTMGIPGREFVRAMVALAPAILGSILTLILTLNLWLAAKAVAISGRLARPWPDIPSVRMPVAAVGAFVLAFVLAQMGGFVGATGIALAGGLTLAFSLQGIALAHDVTRGRPGRPIVLILLYGFIFIIGYVLLPAFALLGIADSALPIRRALRAPSSRT